MTTQMEIIPEMDKVIRTFLPTMLHAAGRTECAQELRDLDPILNLESVLRAATRLNELAAFVQREQDDVDAKWQPLIEDSIFWCEAAMWAAVSKDMHSFKDHIQRVLHTLREGLNIIEYN